MGILRSWKWNASSVGRKHIDFRNAFCGNSHKCFKDLEQIFGILFKRRPIKRRKNKSRFMNGKGIGASRTWKTFSEHLNEKK